MPRDTSVRRVRLRPQDPFDLIRLLARSQSDPRKAVAELVQNSLDAGARRVEITWFNERGLRALRIADDGAGVFP
jgi:DNA mismatch repair protein MutL